ncbi:hypothetical protein [Lichenicoccus sp.]|uniref:hypothetical protein n=1 Tax=Lichenicoccus sp. TaxID=2781899 RepID=UPI003D14530B
MALHGFVDASLNFYATPRGLLVTDKGDTVQLLDGLVLDFPRDAKSRFSDFSIVAGTWSDFNPGYQAPNRNVVNEVDYFAGVGAKLFHDFKAGVQYVAFTSPQRAFHVKHNIEFNLSFDDSPWLQPISIQPYAKLFWAVAGSSTVITGRQGNTFDVELGALPAWDLHAYGAPLVLTAPTWITVGPASYWGGQSNFGVVSAALKATAPLDFIHFGAWYADAAIQFYHIMNSQLILAQMLDGTGQFGTPAHRNFGIWSVGFGLGL